MVSIPNEIIGKAYKKPKDLVARYAKKDFPVLFIGETGSGKELFAQHYMAISQRYGKRRAVNCAEFTSDQILGSEVFGHVKGAFTDAIIDRKGLIRTCNNGILFFDELDSASPAFQAAILRVVEGYGFRPVGSDDEIKNEDCNIRIIATATNLNKIRKDLRHRFNIILIPPLQLFDIPALSKFFLGRTLKTKILKELMGYDYPGNVRELKKRCEQISVERREQIFSEKSIEATLGSGLFDYERFQKEYGTWQNVIQPMIDRYKLNYKYRYFAGKYETPIGLDYLVRTGSYRTVNLTIIEGIELLSNGIEVFKDENGNSVELLSWFVSILGDLFRECTLSYFLQQLSSKIDPHSYHVNQVPDLSVLLDMKFDEAVSQFKFLFLKYYHEKYGTIANAANELEMNEKTFKNRLQRARKALKQK